MPKLNNFLYPSFKKHGGVFMTNDLFIGTNLTIGDGPGTPISSASSPFEENSFRSDITKTISDDSLAEKASVTDAPRSTSFAAKISTLFYSAAPCISLNNIPYLKLTWKKIEEEYLPNRPENQRIFVMSRFISAQLDSLQLQLKLEEGILSERHKIKIIKKIRKLQQMALDYFQETKKLHRFIEKICELYQLMNMQETADILKKTHILGSQKKSPVKLRTILHFYPQRPFDGPTSINLPDILKKYQDDEYFVQIFEEAQVGSTKTTINNFLTIVKKFRDLSQFDLANDLLDHTFTLIQDSGFSTREIVPLKQSCAFFYAYLGEYEKAQNIAQELSENGYRFQAVDIKIAILREKILMNERIQRLKTEISSEIDLLFGKSNIEKRLELIETLVLSYPNAAEAEIEKCSTYYRKAEAYFLMAKKVLSEQQSYYLKKAYNYASHGWYCGGIKNKISKFALENHILLQPCS